MNAALIKWSVMWYGKKGYIVEKDFGHDIQGAVEFYTKLKLLNKKWVTLRSKNVGFPPPTSITEHEEESWEIVRRRGKRYKRKVVTIVNMMGEHNLHGEFWCPYCHLIRKFVKSEDDVNLMCPVCEATTRDFHIRNYNPKATQISLYNQRRRAPNAKPVRKRARRR